MTKDGKIFVRLIKNKGKVVLQQGLPSNAAFGAKEEENEDDKEDDNDDDGKGDGKEEEQPPAPAPAQEPKGKGKGKNKNPEAVASADAPPAKRERRPPKKQHECVRIHTMRSYPGVFWVCILGVDLYPGRIDRDTSAVCILIVF